MQKRIERQLRNIQRAAERKCSSYRTDETIFIDAAVVRKVKRKAIQMKSRIYTHIAGVFYQQCMEELGVWDAGKEE